MRSTPGCTSDPLILCSKHFLLFFWQAIHPPSHVFQEKSQHKREPAAVRVDKVFEERGLRRKKEIPKLLLCILPERNNIYGQNQITIFFFPSIYCFNILV